MTEQQERYDRVAEGYSRWWAPVLRPTAVRLLDRIAPLVESGARRILDLGTGTGTLSIAAIRRWPEVEVVGIDASSEMAATASRAADAELGDSRSRLRVMTSFADAIPLADGSADAVVSSFVLQLVPDRHGALVEAHRLLRPGGRLAHVTWLRGGEPFAPDAVLDRVLDEVGIGPREPEGPGGDYRSVKAAINDLRRAGFRDIEAEQAELTHQFDVEGYAGFVEEFDEQSTFEEMPDRDRERTRQRLREELAKLPPEDLVLRSPVVFAHADRD